MRFRFTPKATVGLALVSIWTTEAKDWNRIIRMSEQRMIEV
jgi:hypothetical protein